MTMKADLSPTSLQGTERVTEGTVLRPLLSLPPRWQHPSQGCTYCTRWGKHPLASRADWGFTRLPA